MTRSAHASGGAGDAPRGPRPGPLKRTDPSVTVEGKRARHPGPPPATQQRRRRE